MLRPYKLGFRRNQAQPVNPLAPTLKHPCPSPDLGPGNTFTHPDAFNFQDAACPLNVSVL